MEPKQTRYHMPDLEANVEQKLEENRKHDGNDGQNSGVNDQPPLINRKIQPFFEENHLRYQALIDKVNEELQFKATVHEVVEDKKATEKKLQVVHNQLSDAKEKHIALDVAFKCKTLPFSKFRILFISVATCIIFLFEGILALPIFETWGYGLIVAFLMCILFAGVLLFFSYVFEKIVQKGRTLRQQRLIFFILLLLLSLLFFYMGNQRAEYLNKQVTADSTGTINIHFSPWPFTLTSLLLFVIAVALHHFFFPSRGQRDAMREYLKLEQEKKANEALQNSLIQEKADIERANEDLRQQNASILEYGSMLETRIITNAHGGYAYFKKQNLMHRPDRGRPISFDDPNYPFTFNTNFHTIKQLNHENHA